MSEAVDTPNETPKAEETPAGEEKPKVVPLAEFMDVKKRAKAAEQRLKDLEAAEAEREKAKLSEVERAQREVDELRKQNQELVVSKARTDAFMKAKSKIGDGFTLEGIEDKLFEKIGKLSYDPETFENDVFELVDLAKKPKSAGKGVIPFGGNGKPAAGKKATEYSAKELAELEKQDPEAFKRVLSERRAMLGFNTSPYSQPQ